MRFVSLAFSVMIIIFFLYSVEVPSATASYDAALLTKTTSFGQLCGECKNNCGGEDVHQLSLEEAEVDRTYGEPEHGCTGVYSNGTCQIEHPESQQCDAFAALDLLTSEQKEDLWNTAMYGTPDELRSAVDHYGESVKYVAERRALQVYGCDGLALLNIPLGEEQVVALQE